MKFNKAIICLIVCFLVFNAAEARGKSKVATKSSKGFFDKIFKDWNKVNIEIAGAQNYKFACSIKDVALDGNALGLAFDGFEQITSQDTTGFIQYIQKEYKVDGQDFQKPVLDYRFIQGCVVLNNAKESSGDWRLDMKLRANEEYNNLQQENVKHGQTWDMRITLPAANKKEAETFQGSLIKNCQARNTLMNKLKNDAITAGNNYNSQYFGFHNRLQSLEDMAKLTKDATKVVDVVKLEQDKQEALIKSQVEENQRILDKTLADIQSAATDKQTTEQETEALSVKLDGIQAQLVDLNKRQLDAKNDVNEKQKTLVELQALKKNQELEKNQIASKTAETQTAAQTQAAKAAADQKEFNRLVAELKLKQEENAKEALRNKAAKEAELAALAAQTGTKQTQLTESEQKIKNQFATINAQRSQIEAIDAQMKTLISVIEKLKEQINGQRTTAQKFAEAIKKSEAQKAANQAALLAVQTKGDAQLAQLGQKLQAQLNLVKTLQGAELAKQNEDLVKTQESIKKANSDFHAALKKIKDQSEITHIELDKAANTVLQGTHVQYISAVVSNNLELMKMSLLRLAKYNRSMQRLARARLAQMTSVRLQQKKLKNKLRSHKHLSA